MANGIQSEVPVSQLIHAEDNMVRTADELEKVNCRAYDSALAMELAKIRSLGMEPTLGDLIALHTVLSKDPKGAGRGLLEIPVMGPAGTPPSICRVHGDLLRPAAQGLRESDIRCQVEDESVQRGFCKSGEFKTATAEAIRSRMVNVLGRSVAEADATPLVEVRKFLTGLAPPKLLTENGSARTPSADEGKTSDEKPGKGRPRGRKPYETDPKAKKRVILYRNIVKERKPGESPSVLARRLAERLPEYKDLQASAIDAGFPKGIDYNLVKAAIQQQKSEEKRRQAAQKSTS